MREVPRRFGGGHVLRYSTLTVGDFVLATTRPSIDRFSLVVCVCVCAYVYIYERDSLNCSDSRVAFGLHTLLSCTLRLHTPHCHTGCILHSHACCTLRLHFGCTPPTVIPVAYSTLMHAAHFGCTPHTVIPVAYSTLMLHTPVAHPHCHDGCTLHSWDAYRLRMFGWKCYGGVGRP